MSAVVSNPPDISSLPLARVYAFEGGCLSVIEPGAVEIRRRRAATIDLALDDESFVVRIGAETKTHEAVASRALVHRWVDFRRTVLLSALVSPRHPRFRAFGAITRPGLLSLPRAAFGHLESSLRAIRQDALTLQESRDLFEQIVDLVADRLPPPKPLDPRIARIINLLHEDVNRPLGDLAGAVHVSYYRLSHLFAENIGMPLRSYQLWQKTHEAFRLLLLGQTQAQATAAAGFYSISHFYRVCLEAFGVPPSVLLGGRVKIARFE